MSLEQVRAAYAATGQWWTGQDALPLGEAHLFILGSTKQDLDPKALAAKLQSAGVTATAYPRNPQYPNLYYFVGVVAGVEMWRQDGSSYMVSTTVDTIEQVVGVDIAVVQKAVWSQPMSPELVTALNNLSAARAANKDKTRIYALGELLPAETWIMLRAYGSTPTAKLGEIVREAGYQTYVFDEGVTGMFVDSALWNGQGWAELAINVGPATDVTPAKLRDQIKLGLGVYDTAAMREPAMQTSISAMSWAQEKARVAGESGESLWDLLGDLSTVLEAALKNLRWVFWGGVGLLGVYGIYKLTKRGRA